MSILFIRLKLFILLSFMRFKGKVMNSWRNFWSNEQSLRDEERLIDEISEITAIEQHNYEALFLQPCTTPIIYMPTITLQKLVEGLPNNYIFPPPAISTLLKEELQNHHQVQVDQQIVERIYQQLPQNYTLHTPFVFNDVPNTTLMQSSKLEIDANVQREISNHLPPHYKFN